MRKTISALLLLAFLGSCITSSHMGDAKGLENLPRDSYTILPECKSVSRSNKFWLLFFPFGGKSEEKREGQCLQRMLKQKGADGVISPKYVHKKITVPLIVFTYSHKWTELTAKPYIVRTDTSHTNYTR